MKKSLLNCLLPLLFLFMVTYPSVAQEMERYRANAIAYNYLDGDGWTDYEDTNLLITFNFDIDRITVYSESRQIYDIIANEGEEVDEDGDTWKNFLAIDQDGDECRFRILERINGDPTEFYIEFSFLKWVYRVIKLT